MSKHAFWGLSLALLTAFSACKKDDDLPEIPDAIVNEPEQITTIELHFKDNNTNNSFEVKWSDPDGPGGNAPAIDAILLDSGKTYAVEVHFYDESGTEKVELTGEINAEGDEHFVCLEAEGGASGAINFTLTDSDGTFPIGLASTWQTMQKGTGELHLKLRHQTNGTKDGTCAPGVSDVDIQFDLTIQ